MSADQARLNDSLEGELRELDCLQLGDRRRRSVAPNFVRGLRWRAWRLRHRRQQIARQERERPLIIGERDAALVLEPGARPRRSPLGLRLWFRISLRHTAPITPGILDDLKPEPVPFGFVQPIVALGRADCR